MTTKFPKDLLTIIAHLKKLPGVGEKTAERFVFQMLKWRDQDLKDLSKILFSIKENVIPCSICGCLFTKDTTCSYCDLEKRDPHKLCIVSSPKEVYAIETTSAYNGLYHVLDKLLSPFDGYGIEVLKLDALHKRLTDHPIKEVIIALDSTLEGDATALFLKKQLDTLKINATRLAFGLPVGSSLEYIDGGTLKQALIGRQTF